MNMKEIITKEDLYVLFNRNLQSAIDTSYIYQSTNGGHVEDLSITEKMHKQIGALENTIAQLERNLNAMKTFNNYYKVYDKGGEK